MFSNLRQGNTIYVLEQSDRLRLKTGKITDNHPNYTGGMDMKVKVDEYEYELKQLPYNQSFAKNGSIIVSENLDTILNEVRNLKAECENKVNNMDYYNQTIEDCDAILRKNDASYDKELKRDEEIDDLKRQNEELTKQIQSMAQSLSNMEKLLSNKN